MWALILTIVVNVQQFPMMTLADGSPVYMRTTSFRVAVGQFSTKTACEAYTGYQGAEFVYSYTDASGNPQSVVFTNVPTTVVGCAKVL